MGGTGGQKGLRRKLRLGFYCDVMPKAAHSGAAQVAANDRFKFPE